MACVTYFVCCCYDFCSFFFFKQKTAYEMRISDWSSDVCSSDLDHVIVRREGRRDRRVLVQQVVYVGEELKLRSVTRVHRHTRAQVEIGVSGDAVILDWDGGEVPARREEAVTTCELRRVIFLAELRIRHQLRHAPRAARTLRTEIVHEDQPN